MRLGNWPARVISYDPDARTLQVHIHGLTDGSVNGLTAKIAYPIGDDDRDTELQIEDGLDVWVFFEGGDESKPVAWAASSHGTGTVKNTRRIRQENIELLADGTVKLTGLEKVVIEGGASVEVSADTEVIVRAPMFKVRSS